MAAPAPVTTPRGSDLFAALDAQLSAGKDITREILKSLVSRVDGLDALADDE